MNGPADPALRADPEPRADPERRRAARAATALGGLLAVGAVTPGALRLAGAHGPAQLVSLRGLVGAGTGMLGLVGALTVRGLARTRAVSPEPESPHTAARGSAARAVAGLSAVSVLATAAQAGILLARGLRTDPLPTPDPTGATLTVVVANTLHGSALPGPLVDLLAGVGAEVIALPESDAVAAGPVVAGLRARGLAVQAFTSPVTGVVASTTLLVADRLGPHRLVRTGHGGPGTVAVVPVEGTGPLLAAVHPYPPRTRVTTAGWRVRARAAVEVGRSVPDAIVAGDFNATLDHPVLRRLAPLADAGRTRRAAGLGTWPQRVPRLLGAPIDHVLATAARWQVRSYSLAVLPGSDHRAVVVRLASR